MIEERTKLLSDIKKYLEEKSLETKKVYEVGFIDNYVFYTIDKTLLLDLDRDEISKHNTNSFIDEKMKNFNILVKKINKKFNTYISADISKDHCTNEFIITIHKERNND